MRDRLLKDKIMPSRPNYGHPFFQRRAEHDSSFKSKGKENNSAHPETQFFAPSYRGNVSSGPRQNNTGLPDEVHTKMETAFGQDFSNVRIHKNSSEATNMDALAFTKGGDVHFAPGQFSPESQKGQELIAHELTHVVQQRSGHVKPTTYHNGDGVNESRSLESQADKMGSLAANGKSAKMNSRRNSVPQNIIQKYTRATGKSGRKNGYNRLSDDGKLAVKDHGKKGYAEDSMITRANTVLRGINSIAEVKNLGNKIDVKAPKTKGKVKNSLTEFSIVNHASGTELKLTDDCGQANQEIMGCGHHGSEKFSALYGPGYTKETGSADYKADDNAAGGIVSTTEKLSGQIYVDIFKTEEKKTLTRIEALKAWAKLSGKKKKQYSKKYGINQFAAPEMGQGITIGSERDMPGSSATGYNFHFGFSLMKSGDDYITLEDYASSGVSHYLDMYGPVSKWQAWSQDSSNTGAMDTRNTTMVVKHPDN